MKSVANTFNYSTCLTVLLLCGTAINTAWSWILPTCTTTHVAPVVSPMLSRISAHTATATAARRNTRLLFAKVRTNLKDAIEPDSVLAVPSKATLKSKPKKAPAQSQSQPAVVLPQTMSSQVEAMLSSGLDYNDLSLIMTIISHECQQLGISYSTSSTMISRMTSPLPVFSNTLQSACSVVGALGRVLVCRVAPGLSPELLETLEEGVCEQLDVMMAGGDHDDDNDNYSNNNDHNNDHNNDREDGFLTEAVLISFQQMNDDVPAHLSLDNDIDGELGRQYLAAIVEEQVREYEMMIPLRIRSGQDDDYNKIDKYNINSNNNNNQPSTSSRYLLPSIHVEMDGGYVTDYSTKTASDDELSLSSEKQEQEKEPTTIWDSSSLLVFDNLVNDDLRKRLLDVVIGSDSNLHDEKIGPDPSRWVRGKLLDVPNEDDNNDDTDDVSNNDSDSNIDNNDQSIIGTGWGLSDNALEEICFQSHDAFLEMESIIATVFPNFRVSRLPEVVLGNAVTPLTANAPTTGDIFDYHIDADPWMTPSSPWTDIYGRYPNRAAGKPRFMSCLIYLNHEWDSEHWGAPTRFVDVPDVTNPEELMTYDVPVYPGRCLIMDQDIGHTVVAPNAAAGTHRPRYSLVWKLILHPTTEGQDMKDLAASSSTSSTGTSTGIVGNTKSVSLWPDIEYFGSAARDAAIEQKEQQE